MVTEMTNRRYLILLASLFLVGSVYAQSMNNSSVVLDDEIPEQIRQEGLEISEIMHTLHMLTDRYGPRLTASPNLVSSV